MHLASVASAVLLALLIAVAGAGPAAALEKRKFDAASFNAAQSSDKSILIDITAPWCPICKVQHRVLDSLAKRPEFKDIIIFEVDFDTQKDVVRSFNARLQATLIAFKGSKETQRLVGETGTEPIEMLLESSLKK